MSHLPFPRRAAAAAATLLLTLAPATCAAAVVSTSAAAGTSAAASVAAPTVQVSLDGTDWAPTMPRTLFSTAGRLVPGSELRETVQLKNTASVPLDMTVQLRWAGSPESSPLDDELTIGLNGQERTVGALRRDPLRIALGSRRPGELTELIAHTQLSAQAENPTQRQYVAVALVVELSAPEAPAPDVPLPQGVQKAGDEQQHLAAGTDAGARGLRLPRTGGEIAAVVTAGAALLTAGLVIVRTARRKRAAALRDGT